MSDYLMGLIQGHAAEPDQPDPDRDRSGRPADDARVHPLRRPHVPPQVPGLKVDLFRNNVFHLFSSTGLTRRSIHVDGAFSCFSTATSPSTSTQCPFGTHFRWWATPSIQFWQLIVRVENILCPAGSLASDHNQVSECCSSLLLFSKMPQPSLARLL